MKKKFALSVLLLFTMGMMFGCGSDKDAQGDADTQKDAETNTYIVGTNPTFAPFESTDDNDQIVGFDIDLMNAIAEDQGFNVEFKSLEFDSLTIELQNGNIDVVASGMSITPDRLESIDFSDPYYNAGLSIMVAKDSDIKSAADLKGKIVGAQMGTTGAEKCYEMEDAGDVAQAKILNSYDMCAEELKNGSCDAIIVDTPVGQKFEKSTDGAVVLLDEQLVADDYGLGIAKGNTELQTVLNKGLADIKENGTYDELLTKWELN